MFTLDPPLRTNWVVKVNDQSLLPTQVSPSSTFHLHVISLLSPLLVCVGWTFVSFLFTAHLELMFSILCYHPCPIPQRRCDIKHLLHAYCFSELKKMKSTSVNASWSLLAKHLYMSYYSPWMLRVKSAP